MKVINILQKTKSSLSTKFLWLYILFSLLLVLIVGGNIAYNLKNNFKDNIRPHLLQYLEYVQSDIGIPPNKDKALEIAEKLSIDISIFTGTNTWSTSENLIDLSQIKYYKQFNENGIRYSTGELDDLEILVVNHADHTLAFSIPHPKDHFHRRHALPVFLIIILLTVFYIITRKLFLPIKTLESGVKRIGNGELEHRIAIHRKDELGSLANSINQMSSDIQQMLEAKRQLLLAISHELRSPVTRAKVAAALLPEGTYSKSIEEELNEIDVLIEEILETERLSTKHHILNLSHANMADVVKKTLEKHFFTKEIVSNIQEIPREINIDVSRIKLLIKNLIDNALKHTPAGNPPPIVSLKSEGVNIILTVQDFGIGIQEKHIPSLTEPFYRVDPSRQRETGGYGLGLYLCKMIAEAHGGKLQINSKDQVGTTVSFLLPY